MCSKDIYACQDCRQIRMCFCYMSEKITAVYLPGIPKALQHYEQVFKQIAYLHDKQRVKLFYVSTDYVYTKCQWTHTWDCSASMLLMMGHNLQKMWVVFNGFCKGWSILLIKWACIIKSQLLKQIKLNESSLRCGLIVFFELMLCNCNLSVFYIGVGKKRGTAGSSGSEVVL